MLRFESASRSTARAVAVCEICGSNPAIYRCAWPDLRYIDIPSKELRAGDKVEIDRGSARVYQVLSATLSHDGRIVYFVLNDRCRTERSAYCDNPISALRLTQCGARCCDCCVRVPDESAPICRDHWHSHEDLVQ